MFFPIRATVSSRRLPVFTIGLILANLIVVWHEANLRSWDFDPFIFRWASIPAHLQHPDAHAVLTIFTSMFLHSGWMHVIGNMWFLWIFGDDLEGRLGRFHFLAFYFVSGLVSDLAHMASNPASTMPVVGASGAISGVLGGYLFMFPGATVTCVYVLGRPRTIELPALAFLLFWFLMQVADALSGVESGIAWYAHIGGFAAGFVLAIIFRK
jgi:membrane associated rhomboid family serine protease